jgi:hypothetical protein
VSAANAAPALTRIAALIKAVSFITRTPVFVKNKYQGYIFAWCSQKSNIADECFCAGEPSG